LTLRKSKKAAESRPYTGLLGHLKVAATGPERIIDE